MVNAYVPKKSPTSVFGRFNLEKTCIGILQLLSKFFIDSDFCHNYLHTLYLFACLL